MLIAFAVFDVKAASYGTPMFMSNEGLAVRGFSDACKDPKSALAQHPGDYSLYKIGTYEPNSGELRNLSPAVHVISAASVAAVSAPAVPDLSSMITTDLSKAKEVVSNERR